MRAAEMKNERKDRKNRALKHYAFFLIKILGAIG